MDPIEIVRWIFNFILTPVAVIGVFVVLITNICRIIIKGFDSDNLEGYQRVAVSVLPVAIFIYVVVGQVDFTWFDLFTPWQLLLGSAVCGVIAAAILFQFARYSDQILVRLLLLFLSGITCFAAYMFIGISLRTGIHVCFGLLIGICGYAVFPNRRPKGVAKHHDDRLRKYRFEAMTAKGEKIKDSIFVESEADAEQKITEMGYFVSRIREVER